MAFRDELMIILSGAFIFIFISSQTGFSIHPRYIILLLPFLYIFISRVAKSRSLRSMVATSVCLLWITVSSISQYPHSMSYFNELACGPRNWPNLLLGSNIDWGQNAYFLKTWTEMNPEARPLYISYTSPISLKKLGIKSDGEVPSEPTCGWIVIGVNELFQKEGKLNWLKYETDATIIGQAVWIIEVRADKDLSDNTASRRFPIFWGTAIFK